MLKDFFLSANLEALNESKVNILDVYFNYRQALHEGFILVVIALVLPGKLVGNELTGKLFLSNISVDCPNHLGDEEADTGKEGLKGWGAKAACQYGGQQDKVDKPYMEENSVYILYKIYCIISLNDLHPIKLTYAYQYKWQFLKKTCVLT